MVKYSPDLSGLVEAGRLEVYRDNMVYHAKSGDRVYRALASEARNNHGVEPSFTVFDELHSLKGAKDQEQLDIFTESSITRLHPCVVYLTHAGPDLNSIAAEKEALIAQYENGVIPQPEGFVYRIYRASPANDWDSEEAFAEANPAYLELIPRKAYLDAVERARQTPNMRRSYEMYHLNRWTSQANAMVNMTDWKACEDDYTAEELEGLPCYGGFDASSHDDLTAFALVFPDADAKTFRTLVHAFIPEERLADKENRDKVPYFQWSEQGHLHLTPGARIDKEYVAQVMLECAEKYDIVELAYDQKYARYIIDQLIDAGIPCVEHRTGIVSMDPPTNEFTSHVVARTMKHNGNPLLTWNVGNLQVREDTSGNKMPRKGSRTEKIDAAFALILALGIAIQHNRKPEPFASYYAASGAIT